MDYLPPSFPYQEIRLHGKGEVFLRLDPEIRVSDLVELNQFTDLGLRPAMSLDEAVAVLGRPPDQEVGRPSRRSYRYSVPSGTIEIVKVRVSSEGQAVDRWFLRFRPEKEILTRLGSSSLSVLPADRRQDQSVYLTSASPIHEQIKLELDAEVKIDYIWWLSTSS